MTTKVLSRLDAIRRITGRWRPVLAVHRADYEGSVIPAAVDLMDAVEAVLKLCSTTEVDSRHMGRPNHIHPAKIRTAITKALGES